MRFLIHGVKKVTVSEVTKANGQYACQIVVTAKAPGEVPEEFNLTLLGDLPAEVRPEDSYLDAEL